MAIPKRIRINRMIDYHTHFIGKFDNGKQFFGYEHFVFEPNKDHQLENRHEYIVLYLFNEQGDLTSYKYWYAGKSTELNCKTETKLNEFIKELGQIRYCDIHVKPFKLEIDSYTFGLIAFDDPDYERVELHPSNTIAFSEPWNGEYET